MGEGLIPILATLPTIRKGFLRGLSMHEPIRIANQYFSDEIPTFGRGNQGVKMKTLRLVFFFPTMANNIAQLRRPQCLI